MGSPIPVLEKAINESKVLIEAHFHEAVDLAEQLPDFGYGDSTTKEIVLHHVLCGCGAETPNARFLDCVIALEAALLGKDTNELAYKFKLYGAAFLRDERDAIETFEQLALVYKVRSNLVHGTPVKPEQRQAANQHAREISVAVLLKAVRDGWPDTKKLDRVALRGAEAD